MTVSETSQPRLATSRRRRWYERGRQVRLHRPVVSVGNIASGGRGKTPVVRHLAALLIDEGERPSVLSRGYGRRLREDGVVVVSDGAQLHTDLDRSGDEPLLLARAVPGAVVAVCEQRALAGTLAEHALGATVHVLDDGFQHLQLARDVDLVLVSAGDLTDRRLPAGRLREPVTSLADADALVIDGDADVERDVRHRLGTRCPPMFRLERQSGPPFALEPDFAGALPQPGDAVVAVASLAQPDRFLAQLAAAGYRVAEALTFRDHHRYGSADVATIRAACRRSHAAGVLTTAKDAERLRPLRPLRMAVGVVPLEVTVEPAREFRRWLLDRLSEVRG